MCTCGFTKTERGVLRSTIEIRKQIKAQNGVNTRELGRPPGAQQCRREHQKGREIQRSTGERCPCEHLAMGCRRGLQAGEEAAPGGVRLGAKEPREGASARHARAPLYPHLAQLADHRRQQTTTSALRAVEFSIVSAWVQEWQRRRGYTYPCKCKAGLVPAGSPVCWIQFRVWIGKELVM